MDSPINLRIAPRNLTGCFLCTSTLIREFKQGHKMQPEADCFFVFGFDAFKCDHICNR